MKIEIKTMVVMALLLITSDLFAADPTVIAPLREENLAEYLKHSEVAVALELKKGKYGGAILGDARAIPLGKGEIFLGGSYRKRSGQYQDIYSETIHHSQRSEGAVRLGYALEKGSITFAAI